MPNLSRSNWAKFKYLNILLYTSVLFVALFLELHCEWKTEDHNWYSFWKYIIKRDLIKLINWVPDLQTTLPVSDSFVIDQHPVTSFPTIAVKHGAASKVSTFVLQHVFYELFGFLA